MRENQLNIGVLTFPIGESGNVPLSNLVEILSLLTKELHVVTGGAGYSSLVGNGAIHLHGVEHTKGARNSLFRIKNYIWTQLKISYELIKLSRTVDLWILSIGGEGLVLPILTAKLLQKKVIIASAGSGFQVAQAQKDSLAQISRLLQSISYTMVDKIILYSERLVKEHSLQKYRGKISIAPRHIIDFDLFKTTKQLGDRDNCVGYIGSLNEAKGVPNFLEAVPRVLKEKSKLEFLIGGIGHLEEKIRASLEDWGLSGKVKLVGWIPHNEVPNYLNKLKLLVLPSYTEGLPNIILEAMACGTPVLATPVGAIPDVIEDGKTGFIMEDNSPDCIASNINRALNHSSLEQISKNALALVEKKFTFGRVLERYEELLSEFARRN
ncbi:glycosyltransferase family 4 protein [Chloroflexota bacterium]